MACANRGWAMRSSYLAKTDAAGNHGMHRNNARDAIMDLFTMITIVVIFGTTTGAITSYLKSRQQQQPPADVLERLQKLERRVGELEAAVTNEERELRRRFAELDASA